MSISARRTKVKKVQLQPVVFDFRYAAGLQENVR
jgi:hypothetical protein